MMKKNTLILYIKRHIHSFIKHIRELLIILFMQTRSQTINQDEEEAAMIKEDVRIPIDIELSDEHKDLCNASPIERVLIYMVHPKEFFNNVYQSFTTLSWKI